MPEPVLLLRRYPIVCLDISPPGHQSARYLWPSWPERPLEGHTVQLIRDMDKYICVY